MAADAPRRLGPYEILGVLGEGGMGRVYRARHEAWGFELAMKVPLGDPGPLRRASILRETEAWASLGLHPHVVTCHYAILVDGVPWIFAELVEGGSLADWIEDRRLYAGPEPLARVLQVATQVALGLDHAHERGLVHQDVKPANVLMTPDGVAKVTDFGLARGAGLHDDADGEGEGVAVGGGKRTLVGRFAGMTPAYASPEQAAASALRAAASMTRRTDVWSWACAVLEMFAGAHTWGLGPRAGAGLAAYAPRPGLPVMPPALRALLARCFAAREADRPATLRLVADELHAIHLDAVGRPPPSELRAYYDGASELYNRGASLLAVGASEKARACFDAALEIDPQHFGATLGASLVRWRDGEIGDVEAVRRVEDVRQFVALRAAEYGASPLPLAEAHELFAWLQAERGANGAAERALADAREVRGAPAPSAERLERALRAGIEPGPSFKVHASVEALAASPRGLAVVGVEPGGDRSLAVFDWSAGTTRQRLEPDDIRKGILVAEGALGLSARPAGGAIVEADGALRRIDGSGALGPRFAEGVVRWASSPRGRVVVERSVGGRVVLELLARDGSTLWSRPRGGPSARLALSEDGSTIATLTESGELSRWEATAGRCRTTAPMGVPLPYRLLALSATGERVALADAGGRLHVYLFGADLPVATLPVDRPVRAEELLERQRRLEAAIAAIDARAEVDPASAAIDLDELARAPWVARVPPVRATWTRLASRAGRGPLRACWSAARIPGREIVALAVDGDGERVLSAERDALEVVVRDPRSGGEIGRLPHESPVAALSLAPLAARLAVAEAGAIVIWDLVARAPLARLPEPDVGVVAFARGGRRLALARGQRVTLLDDTGARLLEIDAGSRVNRLALDPSGERLWVATAESLSGYDVAGRVTPMRAARATLDVAIAADGDRVVAAGADGTLRVYAPDGICVHRASSESSLGVVAVTDDLRLAFTVDSRGACGVWELPAARRLAVLGGQSSGAYALAASADGRVLATATSDGGLRTWFVEWALEPTPRADHAARVGGVLRAARAALGRPPSLAEATRTLAWSSLGHGGRLGAAEALHAAVDVERPMSNR